MQSSGDEPVYVISVAARLADLPSWMLRALDQEGIVMPQRTDSKRRLYSDNDIMTLKRVKALMDKKVNVEGIRVILEMEREAGQTKATAVTPSLSQPDTLPLSAPEVEDELGVGNLPPSMSLNGHRAQNRSKSGMTAEVTELALAIPDVSDLVSVGDE